MTTTTNISSYLSEEIKIYDDPYLKVRVDVRNIPYVIQEDLNNWTQTPTMQTTTDSGYRWVGGTVSGDFTKTVEFPFSGYYFINIFGSYNPAHSGNITLYDESVVIEDSKLFYSRYPHNSYIQYKPHYFSKGNHNLKITFAASGWVSYLTIMPITRYEGDNIGNKYTTNQGLNIKTCEFTRNSVSEMNQLTLTTDMQENYWNRDPSNFTATTTKPTVFDWQDHITVWLGADFNSTKVMYGGYSFPSDISADNVLTLKAVDRMYDLQRVPLQKNTESIGNGGFPSVYELCRYLGSAAKFSLNTFGVPYDYAFYHDFSTAADFNSVTVTGAWAKTHDFLFGNPLPSMKLTVGTPGTATCQLFLDLNSPFDANVYNKLNIDYYYAAPATTPPFAFNIHIKMYKGGEAVGDVVEYVLHFTGGTETVELADVAYGSGGSWRNITVDLKALFNAIASSSNYYVTDIHLSSASITSGTMWIDQVMAYKELDTAPNYSATDLSDYYAILQDLCDKTGHSSYIIPGDSRAEDDLAVLPQNTITMISEVGESELVEFGGWTSDPISDGFTNWMVGTFQDDGGTDQSVTNIDWNSVWKYGDSGVIESVNYKNAAQAQSYIDGLIVDKAYPSYGFTLKARGLADIVPLQNLHVDLRRFNIYGDFPIKSTTYNYDIDSNPKLTTSIDLNRPSRRFKNWVRSTRSNVGLLNRRSESLGLYTIGV